MAPTTNTTTPHENNTTRLLVVLALLVAAVWTGALPARAEAPGNDTLEGSTPIDVPFWGEQDTSEATSDEVDAALNEECGAPATDASVWYQLTPAEDLAVDVFVGESDYSAGVIVAEHTEEGLHVVTCGPEGVFFIANAEATYQLMLFDDQVDGAGNGGNLVIHVEGGPVGPPPEVDLSVDPVGTFQQDGSATITGTLICSGDVEFVDVFGQVTQEVGRFAITGWFGLFEGEGEENGEVPPPLSCDGSVQAWSAVVHPDNGLFKGGRATVEAEVFACGFFECAEDTVTETIRLRRSNDR